MNEKPDEYLEDEPEKEDDAPVEVLAYTPESTDETVRKSGLAYSAGVVLFGCVIFMLVLGWGFDSYFGTSPICLIGGITLGAVLGFYNFFRITSQIINKS